MMPGYGRMLTHTAQYIDASGDVTLLNEFEPHLDAVVTLIRRKLNASRLLPLDNIAHGILLGCDEADSCTEYGTWVGTMGELPYFSSAMEVWRGLVDLGQIYVTKVPAKAGEGEQLRTEAKVLSADIKRSWARSVNTNADGSKCYPYVAGAGLNRSIPLNNCSRVEGMVPSYHPAWHPGGPQTTGQQFKRTSEPWRAFPEMYHSGWLQPDEIAAIHKYCMDHDKLARLGIYGGVNIENGMFGHTAYGEAFGLLAADMVPEFLLFLFAQSHHVYTTGTWTGFEKTVIDRSVQGFYQFFASPAQLTVPTALRWSLVFDDAATGTIALGRAVPRKWLSQPNASIAVENAPVSRQLLTDGTVSFSVQSAGGNTVIASVTIGKVGAALKSLSLRVRAPLSWGAITTLTVGGTDMMGSLGGKSNDTLTMLSPLPSAASLASIKTVFGTQEGARSVAA